jgi:stress response protein YsnF
MESSTFGPVTDWNEVIKKEARGLNDADLGEVQEVNDNYVLTQRGTISKEKFYLPKSIPHGYNGHILLFDITEEDAKAKFIVDTSSSAAAQEEEGGGGGEGSKVQTRDAESPIPVIEERLEVSKKESVVEAKVIKKPVKETKTVEVELTHEELIIEKRSVAEEEADKTTVTSPSPTATTTTTTPSSSSTSQEITQSKTEINIPLKREDVVVSKKPYVKEEIIIKKKPVTETKTITEQVTSEKVYVRNANGEKVEEEEEEEEVEKQQ